MSFIIGFVLLSSIFAGSSGQYVEEFQRFGCQKYKQHHAVGFHVLDATSTSSPPIWCRALAEQGGTSSKYTVRVQLMNQEPNTGHPGIMFNVKESDVFDFIYFRPHSPGACYQTGFSNQDTTFSEQGPCAGGNTPVTGVWFDLKVVVDGKNARAFIDGKLAKTWTTQFNALPRAGVMTANAYENVIRFANFRLDID